MERGGSGNGGVEKKFGTGEGWDEWEAVPRDGPAVFAVDSRALDEGVIRGRWLDVHADQVTLRKELGELLGQGPEAGAWVVVDQVGLGELMAPETMTVTDLAALAGYLAAESQA